MIEAVIVPSMGYVIFTSPVDEIPEILKNQGAVAVPRQPDDGKEYEWINNRWKEISEVK